MIRLLPDKSFDEILDFLNEKEKEFDELYDTRKYIPQLTIAHLWCEEIEDWKEVFVLNVVSNWTNCVSIAKLFYSTEDLDCCIKCFDSMDMNKPDIEFEHSEYMECE